MQNLLIRDGQGQCYWVKSEAEGDELAELLLADGDRNVELMQANPDIRSFKLTAIKNYRGGGSHEKE